MRRAAALALFLMLPLALCAMPVMADANFAPGGTAQIRDVVDGMTVDLVDGRVLRLVDIAAPMRGARGRMAKSALATLVSGHLVELRFAGNPRDRRGRVLAELYAGAVWVQAELVRRGLVRVFGTADNRAGVPDLLALEREARRNRRGLWSDPAYAIRRPDEAGKFAGTVQIVAGKVANVLRASGHAYVHFGTDRRRTLSLSIAGPALRLCRKAGLDPRALAGKNVQVRGFIDGPRYPTIFVTYPEQIEILK